MNSLAQSDSCQLYIPNVLSMDCETGNDYILNVYVSCPIDTCRFSVYNKWGQVLYDTDSKTPVWDGSKQAEGEYFYFFKGIYSNKREFDYCGKVYLIR